MKTFHLQGKQLYNNIQANTIVSNQSLVLQSITRARTGLYTCVGHNQEGDGESNPVQLDVKCKYVYRFKGFWKYINEIKMWLYQCTMLSQSKIYYSKEYRLT